MGFSDCIDEAYFTADFLARLVVVFSSEYFADSIRKALSERKIDLTNINKLRARRGEAPFMPVSPIRIDLTRAASFKKDRLKQLRLLLGWTRVKRSRQIISKYGVSYFRSPHDRRIEAPVDRRNAVREVTMSSPAELRVREHRPEIVRKPNDEGEGSTPK